MYRYVTSNIAKRLTDRQIDFKTTIHFGPCQHLDFHQAADYTAHRLPDKKKFVAFSGGADSEYVVRTLKRNNIEFTPVIVHCKRNNLETLNALRVCQELQLKPDIIEVSEIQLFRTFVGTIYYLLNGIGINSTPCYIAAKHATERQGILITGDHHMDDHRNTTGIGMIEIAEWEFYNDALLPGSTIIFYSHTLELLRALACYTDPCFDEFKCSKIYNIRDRLVTGYCYSPQIRKFLDSIERKSPKWIDYPMSKQEFISQC